MRSLLPVAFVLLATLSWSCSSLPSPQGGQSDRTLTIIKTALPSESLRIRLDDAWVTITRRQWSGAESVELRARLDPAQEQKIWHTVDRLGVWNWREHYRLQDVSDGTMYDGIEWSVTVSHKSRRHSIDGNNAYPALDPLGEPTLSGDLEQGIFHPNAFSELLREVHAIAQEAAKRPQPEDHPQ